MMGWSTTLFLVTVVSAHSYSSSPIGWSGSATPLSECAPDAGCIGNRVCGFGTEENYKIARAALFQATGRSTTCYDQCTCSPNPSNQVDTILVQAQKDQYIYGNNTVCNSHVLQAAMYYHTAGFTCETVFLQAQSDLIRLCGVQNGRSCLGKCTEQYQIDTPPPMCEEHVGIDEHSLYAILGYIVLAGVLWSWTAGVEIGVSRGTQLQNRFVRTRYVSSRSNGDSEMDALLGALF